MPLVDFPYQIALATTSSTVLDSRGDNEHAFLVLDLSGKAPSVFPLREMFRKYSAVLIFLSG